ncbi:hypothetical protein ABFP60_15960 [Clostridioides difficile]
MRRNKAVKKKKWVKNKLICAITVCVVLTLAISTLVYSRTFNNLNLEIEDSKISNNEYIRAMNSKKYEVTQYFIEKYGAKVTDDFWYKEFEGEYPYKMLADRTIEELKRIHGIYEVAKEKGYVESVEYKDFVTRLNNENKGREESIKKGKPIYGLSKYTEDLFLEYETDSIQKMYCDDLTNEGMEISLEDGTTYYNESKDKLFLKNDDFELEYVKVYYSALELDENQVNEIKNSMIEVSKKIDGNNSLESLCENNELLKQYFNKETILSAEVSSMAKIMGDVLEIAMELQSGDVTQVIDQNGCLYLIQCINRVDYDYIPYEEVADNVKKALREERYEEIVTKRASELEVSNDINSVYSFTKNNIK